MSFVSSETILLKNFQLTKEWIEGKWIVAGTVTVTWNCPYSVHLPLNFNILFSLVFFPFKIQKQFRLSNFKCFFVVFFSRIFSSRSLFLWYITLWLAVSCITHKDLQVTRIYKIWEAVLYQINSSGIPANTPKNFSKKLNARKKENSKLIRKHLFYSI